MILILCLAPLPLWSADSDVVLNEIMYHPPGDRDNLQYVELFNRGETEVDLSKWSFTKGVKFTFPAGTKLGPQSFLVVCRNLATFAAHYGSKLPALGNLTGRLSHRDERLELSNGQGKVIDSVKYADRGDWPRGADGYSSSLERICPSFESDKAENWSASAWPASERAAGTPGRKNDAYSAELPPVISKVEFSPKTPAPQEKVTVTATVADADGVKSVILLCRVAASNRESEEVSVAMKQVGGDEKAGTYQAAIEGQPEGCLVRFRIQAAGSSGGRRLQPSENDPRPAYSYYALPRGLEARIPLGFLIHVGQRARGPGHYQRNPSGRSTAASMLRGNGAFIYVPADGGEAITFDFVKIVARHGGVKVYFQNDAPFKAMTTINLISEGPPRWLISEPLAYALYRMAGVAAPLTEHIRLTMDGRNYGYRLLVEQPNRSFLARNGRDDSGNLYKLIWYGQGVVGQHEKKTNPATGHADVIELIEGLRRRSGSSQWAFIQQHLNVDDFINYYVVNMCIQNWDGFFNNYFIYHDTGRTGKWEIYPWDEDKTWGDYDGASFNYDWYQMPLTMGMNGDQPPRSVFSRFSQGPFGGASWWRPPGYLSGPLLANPEFRGRFLARLRQVCATIFTEESVLPIIDAMEQRLAPEEVRIHAQATGQNPEHALREFAHHLQTFRNQVVNRRQFILGELEH